MEAPGVLAWLVEGCLIGSAEGHRCPRTGRSGRREGAQSAEHVEALPQQCCVVGNRSKVSVKGHVRRERDTWDRMAKPSSASRHSDELDAGKPFIIDEGMTRNKLFLISVRRLKNYVWPGFLATC